MLPTRFAPSEKIVSTFGQPRVDRLGGYLLQGDDLGDAAALSLEALPAAQRHAAMAGGADAPDAMRALIADASTLPVWADLDRCRRGGELVLKAGFFSGLVLALKSLISGYASPAGNKPLIFTGRLEDDVPKRLVDTARFVHAVSATGIGPGSAGFHASLHVRLVHSRVRVGLTRSPKWKADEWGVPVNQYDMAGTTLLFSLLLLQGIEQLGARPTTAQAEDMLHLWRVCGHVLGVRHELLSATRAEAETLWQLIDRTQHVPDEDSRRLTRALLEGPRRVTTSPTQKLLVGQWVDFTWQVSRALIGDERADALGYPKRTRVPLMLMVRAIVSRTDMLRRWLPPLDSAALKLGQVYWERTAHPAAARAA